MLCICVRSINVRVFRLSCTFVARIEHRALQIQGQFLIKNIGVSLKTRERSKTFFYDHKNKRESIEKETIS